eukprot:m.115674 g.115674  ORF g.115674 m.115674 type:complete len:498 (-) comp9170_c1_seq5:98-1591(-)
MAAQRKRLLRAAQWRGVSPSLLRTSRRCPRATIMKKTSGPPTRPAASTSRCMGARPSWSTCETARLAHAIMRLCASLRLMSRRTIVEEKSCSHRIDLRFVHVSSAAEMCWRPAGPIGHPIKSRLSSGGLVASHDASTAAPTSVMVLLRRISVFTVKLVCSPATTLCSPSSEMPPESSTTLVTAFATARAWPNKRAASSPTRTCLRYGLTCLVLSSHSLSPAITRAHSWRKHATPARWNSGSRVARGRVTSSRQIRVRLVFDASPARSQIMAPASIPQLVILRHRSGGLAASHSTRWLRASSPTGLRSSQTSRRERLCARLARRRATPDADNSESAMLSLVSRVAQRRCGPIASKNSWPARRVQPSSPMSVKVGSSDCSRWQCEAIWLRQIARWSDLNRCVGTALPTRLMLHRRVLAGNVANKQSTPSPERPQFSRQMSVTGGSVASQAPSRPASVSSSVLPLSLRQLKAQGGSAASAVTSARSTFPLTSQSVRPRRV